MNIKVGNLILAVGRRGSGKSTILRYISTLLLKSKQYDYFKVVSPTALMNGDWNHLDDDDVVTNEIEEYVENLYKNQQMIMEQESEGKKPNGLLILDDIAGAISFRKREKLWGLIASCGRHYKITTIFCTQYIHTASPIIRTQSDLVILMGRFSGQAIKSIFEQYSPIKSNDEADFKKTLNEYTKNYGALVMDNRNGAMYSIRTPEGFKAPKVKQGKE